MATKKPVYRISSIGYCPRKLSAMQLQVEEQAMPKWLEQAAEEGNWHEARVKHELLEEGLTIKSVDVCTVCKEELNDERHGIHIEREFDQFILIGHMDGLVIYDRTGKYFKDDRERVLEVKSMSQYEFDRWMKGRWNAFPQYAAQLTVYMALHDNITRDKASAEALYVVKNRNNGYKDIFVQVGYPMEYSALIKKVTEVNQYVMANKLYPASYDPTSIECKRCQYKGLCIPDVTEKFSDIQEKEFMAAAEQWRKGKELVKEGEGMVTEAEALLKGRAEVMSEGRTKPYRYNTNGLNVSGYIKASISYPKEKVESVIKNQKLLEEIKSVKQWWECRITDTQKEDN